MSQLVLLADDDPASRFLAAELLRLVGFETAVAADGGEAVRLAADRPIALAILDVQMPVMNGFETLAALRELPGLSRLRAIALTAYASPEDRERMLRGGFEGYLSKPLDVAALSSEIARLLA